MTPIRATVLSSLIATLLCPSVGSSVWAADKYVFTKQPPSAAQSMSEPAASPTQASPQAPTPAAGPTGETFTFTGTRQLVVAAPAEPVKPKKTKRQASSDKPSSFTVVKTPAIRSAGNEATTNADVPQIISISTGFQEVLATTALPARVAVGDPDIAEVSVLKPTGKDGAGAGVLIVGKQAGSTSLLVWSKGATKPKSITLAVTGKTGPSTSNVQGLTLDTQGNVLRLSGSISNVAAYQQVRSGLTRSSAEGKSVDLVDTTTLSVPGTVQVDVKVVEFSRNELQRAGISFNKTNGSFKYGFVNPGTSASSSSVSQAFQVVANRVGQSAFDLQLAMLESDGYAKVLAEPSLIAQSGQAASFLAGGEVPIPVPSGTSGSTGAFTIQYKSFGIRLDFTPTILSNRTIALKVSPEVSDLDFSKGITVNGFQVPALTTRRADTTVELGEGESFIIGGLVSRSVIANIDKVPGLSQLPILGAFFKSVSYTKQDKELVIVATPRFVKPRAKNAPALPLPGEGAGDSRSSLWGTLALPQQNNTALPGFSN